MKKLTKSLLLLWLILPSIAWSQCFVSGFGSLGTLSKTTGNSSLDNWFNSQKTSIESVFDVEADLYIYDDGYYSPNAYATHSNYADGQIAFGIHMLTQYLWRFDKGKAAVAAVLAHEYAHVLQIEYDSDLSWKYKELHADFLAGFYLSTKGYVNYGDLNNFAKAFFDLGDNAFWSESHHGTHYERLNAFKAGYNCNCNDADEAFDEGEEYVLGKSTYERQYQTCLNCRGSGVISSVEGCRPCNGYGQLVCASCSGNGGYWYYGQWIYCSSCSASGRLVCGTCYGEGQNSSQYYCSVCSGTGQVIR